ncbi:hypothetical protein RCL_jg11678.t1 [Rhizophagus clarus]|uniref:Crinkler effector protein N-terminal domain-containing protein n=1 Tax=Rhizophagus clarus TaxID=94130 RepID=A0A8H3R4M0_9GLOM|nr:hypothetical protein RCL_jg11678.t1 [Rhizophagus clarus]
MLFCLILGDNIDERFEIGIETERTVSALQKAVEEEKKPAHDEIDIEQDLGGRLLEPDDEINNLFDQHDIKQISILVQSPPPATLKKQVLPLHR